MPDGPTFLLANEFIDALPIRQFQMKGGQWFERMVTLKGRFVFALAGQPFEDLDLAALSFI